jgi:hypothetical protein
MKCRTAGRVATVMIALADIAGLRSAAMGQAQKPEASRAPNQNSARSSPPDTTPYVRPVIPEDRIWAPSPAHNRTNTSWPAPSGSVDDHQTKPEQGAR